MICKKCGTNIENNLKFCGVCGEKVEESVQQQNIQPESVVQETTTVVPLIQPELVQVNEVHVVQQNSEGIAPVMPTPEMNTVPVAPIPQANTVPVVPVPNKEPKKKNNTWIFVILGVLLGIIAIALVYFAYSKSANNSVKVLEKALVNTISKGENSGTIDAKILIQSETDDSMNLSATIKYAKQSDDNYNFNLTLNKSMFFDEMNIYASILDENATLFVNSSVIDMLGLTSSTPSMWLYMTMTEEELEMQTETETETEELEDINLSKILDEEHFKLIDEQNNLKHYQLVIDNDLIDKIKIEASKEEDLKDLADSLSDLTETYYIDFYINNSNELVKISMDLTKTLNDESIKNAVLSFEFNNFGSTIVEIPTEAKKSTIDLETYMTTYAITDETNSLDDNYINEY